MLTTTRHKGRVDIKDTFVRCAFHNPKGAIVFKKSGLPAPPDKLEELDQALRHNGEKTLALCEVCKKASSSAPMYEQIFQETKGGR